MSGRATSHNRAEADATERDVREVDARLACLHGDNQFPGASDPLGGLVYTILSQSTTAANSSRAYEDLVRRFPSWDALAQAPVGQIARAIRSGGLARQKAPRIRTIIRRIIDENGGATLDFIERMSVKQATEYLLGFDGVGPKTAACVLLFSMGRQVFPVDTHVRRISERLGWVPPGLSDVAVHDALGRIVPPELCYRLHVNMVTHGREVCKARSPQCDGCPLQSVCDHSRERGPAYE